MEKEDGHLDIAVLIATLNEEEGIAPTMEELRGVLDDACYLVVDGRSVDKTVEIAKKAGAKVIFQDGKGKGDAIGKGIKHLDSNLRYVVFIDADVTYPAQYIPRMIEILENNPDVGMVIGNRFDTMFDFEEAINNAFYLGNRLLAYAQHFLNGIKLQDPLSGLRVVRWEILRGWNPKSKGFDVEAEMNYHVEREGYQTLEIPIRYRSRLGEKKLKFRHGFTILRRIVTESLLS